MTEFYIFGFNGFVGSHFTEQLLRETKERVDIKIHLISRQDSLKQLEFLKVPYKNVNLIRSKIEHIPKSLFISESSKVIYYFAAEVDFYAKEDIVARNVVPFNHILSIVPVCETNEIVYISTLGVFDRDKKVRDCPPLREDSPNFPSSYYGVGKLKSEKLLKSSGHNFQIIRLPWCYGSRMKTSHHLIQLQGRMKSPNPVYFFNWPGRISVLSVDAIYLRINTILEMFSKTNEINVSDAYAPTFGELFQILGRGIGKQRGRVRVPNWVLKSLNSLIPYLPFTARCLFQNALYTKSDLNERLFPEMGDIREFNEERLGDRLDA